LWSSAGSERSQWASFLATNDHFSSNWSSVVRGGEGDQLVVGRHGVVAGLAGVAGHGVAVDPHQAFGLANSASLGEVLQDGGGLFLGQMRTEQRGPLAFGEAIAAGAASEEADRGVVAVATGDGEVFAAADAVIGTSGIQAAESSEVVHGPPPATYPTIRARSCGPESG
jgi:hypothetical protein